MTNENISQLLRVTEVLCEYRATSSPTNNSVFSSVNGLNGVRYQNTDRSQFFQYLALASNKYSDILNIPATLTVSPEQACS
jgi:hypothetical protein